jgi:tRNA U55 pseudouridine synthase TruB
LARDLSEALGLTTGAVYSLRRQKVGPYALDQAAKAMDKESLLSALIPPRDMIPGFPEYLASASEIEKLRKGLPLEGRSLDPLRLYVEGKDGLMRPFLEELPKPMYCLSSEEELTQKLTLPWGSVKIVGEGGELEALGKFMLRAYYKDTLANKLPHDLKAGTPSDIWEGLLSRRPILRPLRIF